MDGFGLGGNLLRGKQGKAIGVRRAEVVRWMESSLRINLPLEKG
jgi:hypothetical protein